MAAQAAEEDVLAIASIERVASEDDHEGAGWLRGLCLQCALHMRKRLRHSALRASLHLRCKPAAHGVYIMPV